jgi:aminoglycoside 3-N-acetyltransferase
MPVPVFSSEDLDHHLAALGVAEGDDLLVHSRLVSFGLVEGGETTFHEALRRAVGPDGTLVFPTYTLWLDEGVPYDPERTQSQRMGLLPEYVRSLPGSVRTACPKHNHTAIGPKAELLGAVSGNFSLGPGSDFEVFLEQGFSNLFLGCGIAESATYIMHLEAMAQVPWRSWVELTCPVIDESGKEVPFPVHYFARSDMTVEEDLNAVQETVLAAGVVKVEPCPFGQSYFVSVADFHRVVLALFLDNPYVTVK